MVTRIKALARNPRKLLIALGLLAIFALYIAIRLLNIDRVVTTDEPFWLGRSANFYRALVEGELEHTYQMAHPGVMTMWAGALAYWIQFPEYAELATGNLADVYSIEAVLRGMGQDPLTMMLIANISKIMFQSVFFLIALAYLTKLVGVSITVIIGLLMVFAPFASGFDSALHVDGLFTAICFAAILAIAFAAFGDNSRTGAWQRLWPWIAAGILAGMAILTRATGIVLIGVAGLALLIQLVAVIRTGRPWIKALRAALGRGLLWLAAAAVTSYALLPALWVNPGETMSKLWAWSSSAATEGHEIPTFYRGIQSGNPGYLVYPEVLAWRTSPVEWLGLLLLVVVGIWGWRKRVTAPRALVKLLLIMLVFVVVYVAAMSIGAKKFDRYVLPVFPVVTVFAGAGIAIAFDWLRKRSFPRSTLLATSLTGLLIVGQVASWANSGPYRLDYYNPLLGGAQKAQHILQMGWGQGGDQVVDFLNDQAQNGPINVQTSAVPSAFTYLLEDDSPVRFRSFDMGTPAGWYETDYYVAGIQQTQRDLAPVYRTLRHYESVHTVDVNGVPYFEIFNVRNLPLPESLLVPTACNYSFGNEITLMQIIGRGDAIDFYFMSTTEVSEQTVTLSITVSSSDAVDSIESVAFQPGPPNVMSKVTIPYQDNHPLDEAEIVIRAETETSTLSISAPWLAEDLPAATTHSECYYTDAPAQ